MREYIILVAAASIISALADVLAPKEWRGYIRLVAGFLILAVLISPIAKLKNKDIFDPIKNFEPNQTEVRDLVTEELRKRIGRDIEERILTEFKSSAKASCEIDVDEEHKIKGVRKITVTLKKVPEGLKKRLSEVYGCENIEFRPE